MLSKNTLEQATGTALQRWETPFPGFTSGGDPRSSDNALLVLIHGGLAHAARHDWLNAGRRLIDKTYVDILWHVQQLTEMRACNAERIAAALDDVIRTHIAPEWASLGTLPTKDKTRLATDRVEHLAANAFGSLHSEPAASRLLFYLCPTLPGFNFSRGHLVALEHLGFPTPEPRYRAFATTAANAYRELSTALNTTHTPCLTSAIPNSSDSSDTCWTTATGGPGASSINCCATACRPTGRCCSLATMRAN